MEVLAYGESVHLNAGGVEADNEVVRKGMIAHMRKGTENRWCVPPDLLQLRAFWFGNNAFAWDSRACFGLRGWLPELQPALSDLATLLPCEGSAPDGPARPFPGSASADASAPIDRRCGGLRGPRACRGA